VNVDDVLDEGSWLDDMPAFVPPRHARAHGWVPVLVARAADEAAAASRKDEDARAATRRIGVER
jgi:hypothetical protein